MGNGNWLSGHALKFTFNYFDKVRTREIKIKEGFLSGNKTEIFLNFLLKADEKFCP